MILRDFILAVESILATASPEEIAEAQRWTADCWADPEDPEPFPAPYAAGYVVRNYPGGWTAFVADCCAYTVVQH